LTIAIARRNAHPVSIINPLEERKMKRIHATIAGALALCIAAPVAGTPEKTPAAPASNAVAATAADVKPGAALRDINGAQVGTVVSSTDQQVVVDTGQTKIGVPLNIFKKDEKGLMLGITAQQFNDAIAKAHARAQAQQQAQQGQPVQPAQQPPK
jgi:hypothetical protein